MVSLVVQCNISSLNHLQILLSDFRLLSLPLPLPIGVYVKRIKHHSQASRPAILRLRLRRVLLCKAEVIFHGPRNQAFLEYSLPYRAFSSVFAFNEEFNKKKYACRYFYLTLA